MDEYYSKNLASNVKRALKYNASKCLTNGGTAPLGYDVIDRKYIVNQDEAIIVKFIYENYLKGYSYLDIINMCNERNFKTKKGNAFKKNSIYEILHNEKYLGTYIYNKASGNNRHKLNDDVIKVENAFKPIIDRKTFYEVQNKTKENKKSTASYCAKNVYLLSGLIFCGKCGSRYTAQTTHKKKNGNVYSSSYYVCSNRNKVGKCTNHRVKRDELEKYVINCLLNKILGNKSIDEICNNVQIEYNKLIDVDNSFKSDLNAKLQDLNKKINNLLTALENGSSAIVMNRINELENEKQDIETRLAIDDVSKEIITNEEIKKALSYDLTILSNGTKQEIKNIINKYIHKIIIDDDILKIYYTFNKSEVLNMYGRGDTQHYKFKTIEIDIKQFLAKRKS